MPDFSKCRGSINNALLRLGGKYICLRHLSAIGQEDRLEFASRVMFENAADAEMVCRTVEELGLFDDGSPNFCGNPNGKILVERYLLKEPAYRCYVHAEKMLGKGCVNRFCGCCTCQKNETRTEMERYLAQVYYHSPERFELDPKTVASKLCCRDVFSCIDDERKCHYIEMPIYQAFFLAVSQLRKENRLNRISIFEADSKRIAELITTKNKEFTDWKYRMRPPESFYEISSQVAVFVLYFLKAPYTYDEHKFKSMAAALYSNTVYSDIPKNVSDTFFMHDTPSGPVSAGGIIISEETAASEMIISVPGSGEQENTNCNEWRKEMPELEPISIPYGIIEESVLSQKKIIAAEEWQPSELMEIDEVSSLGKNNERDVLLEYDDYAGIIIPADTAAKDGIRILSFSEFTHYCGLLRKSPMKLSLEPATVGDVFGLLLYCPVEEYHLTTVFADCRFLSRDFFLDIMLRNGTLAVMCNLCLFMSIARKFSVKDIYNARSLGAAFCLLSDSDSVYPMKSIVSASGLSKENPSVPEMLQCYATAWDSAGYDIFCRDGMKRKYMYTVDYENALSTSYGFRRFMGATFENMIRESYLVPSFSYDDYRLGLVPKTGRLVTLTCSPLLSDAGKNGARRYFFTVLLHYVLTHNDVRMHEWSLVSLRPDGITLHVETNDRSSLEAVLDALESAYTSTVKISSFCVSELVVKRSIF